MSRRCQAVSPGATDRPPHRCVLTVLLLVTGLSYAAAKVELEVVDLLPVWERRIDPEELHHVLLETNVGSFDRWISEGVSCTENERARRPTAVGGEPRRHPPGEPACVEQCEDEAPERWIRNNCSVPPCHGLWKYPARKQIVFDLS